MENDFVTVNITINKQPLSAQVKKKWTLLYYLREVLELTGTKNGCGTNDCGACKVLVDGDAKNSCVLLMRNLEGKNIVTIEGLLETGGKLNVIQQSFIHLIGHVIACIHLLLFMLWMRDHNLLEQILYIYFCSDWVYLLQSLKPVEPKLCRNHL